MHKDKLLSKFEDRSAVVGVIGLGYVGLPLAVEFAKAGFNVIGIDIDQHKVDSLNAGRSYIPDVKTEDVATLRAASRLTTTSDFAALHATDAVSICVPTPLRKTRDPDMSYVIGAAEKVAEPATLWLGFQTAGRRLSDYREPHLEPLFADRDCRLYCVEGG